MYPIKKRKHREVSSSQDQEGNNPREDGASCIRRICPSFNGENRLSSANTHEANEQAVKCTHKKRKGEQGNKSVYLMKKEAESRISRHSYARTQIRS